MSSEFFANCGGSWCVTPSGKELTFLSPGNAYRWVETAAGKSLGLVNVDISKVTNTNRAQIRDKNFTVVYTLNTQYRNLDQTQIL